MRTQKELRGQIQEVHNNILYQNFKERKMKDNKHK